MFSFMLNYKKYIPNKDSKSKKTGKFLKDYKWLIDGLMDWLIELLIDWLFVWLNS